jgi:flagella basal body P-ring formation protein FlgA
MNKTFRLLSLIWLITVCSVGTPQPCSADTPVTLRAETQVRHMTVKLSDVFDGVPKDIDRDIAQSPPPGKQVIYDVTVLRRIADKYRLGWEPQSASDHATISTASTRITADSIREAVVKKVKDNNPLPKGGEVDVSFDNHALQIDLPADCAADFTLNNFDYDTTSKHFHADLVATGSSGAFSVPVTGRLTFKRNIPVLVRRLEGGTTIGVADIDWSVVPEDRVNMSVIVDANDLIGHELRRDTDEGEILHAHDVMPPRLVVRGSPVTMKIETPLMLVTAQGKAMQDGTQGEIVRVLNTQSNRMLEGVVSGPGTVTINAGIQKVAVANEEPSHVH